MTIFKKTFQGKIACFIFWLEKRLPKKQKAFSFKDEFDFCLYKWDLYLTVLGNTMSGFCNYRIV